MVNVPLPMLLRMAVAVSPNAPRMAEAVSVRALCNAVLSSNMRVASVMLSAFTFVLKSTKFALSFWMRVERAASASRKAAMAVALVRMLSRMFCTTSHFTRLSHKAPAWR